MSMQKRRTSSSSSATSEAIVKRPAAENAAKTTVGGPPQQPKKRVALSNITNQSNAGQNPTRSSGIAGNQVSSTSTTSKLKKGSFARVGDSGLHQNTSFVPSIVKQAANTLHSRNDRPTSTALLIAPLGMSASLPKNEGTTSYIPPLAPCSVSMSPDRSDGGSVSLDETMSTCSSLNDRPISTAPLIAPLGMSASLLKNEGTTSYIPPLAPCSMSMSPDRSDGGSVSLDETMSTCSSLKSPDIEYLDSADASTVASLERRTSDKLYISEHADGEPDHIWKKDILMGMGTDDMVVDIDDNQKDPQLCATIACDIYKHLRIAEMKKRPSTNFMEVVQADINASMRAILIDWLVEVAEEYRLVPDTLYLTVNYIDRYLSGNVINRQRLQLLGVACMLIAAKYEEICAPQVEEFCYITDNTYFKDEVLQMEASVLNYLKFEMTAPTAKCFMRRFLRVAQGSSEVPLLQLEFLANYLAELSLLEYSFLRFSPSLIAASAIFLAKFILTPSKKPWNATLRHYTLYQPSELCGCVKDLHRIFCNGPNGGSLPAIREKYSQHKYKFVAKKYCPPTIPLEFFLDISNQ